MALISATFCLLGVGLNPSFFFLFFYIYIYIYIYIYAVQKEDKGLFKEANVY